jgi:hypothetical protein
MPLQADVIKANDALKDLTEEQVKAIETLSTNVFKEEIDTYAGTTKRRWEEDVKKLFGKDKPDGSMPAHKFLEWAVGETQKEYEAKLEAAAKAGSGEDAEKLKKKITELQEELKDAGMKGSELLKQDIEGYKKRLSDHETLIADLKKQAEAERKELEGRLQGAQQQSLVQEVGYEKAQALIGVEFDSLVDETIRREFLDSKWRQILSEFTPEKDENGKTQWRDKEGKLKRSATNSMEPVTTKELYLKEIEPILKKGRNQGGAGTGAGTGGSGSVLDLRGAKTQVEADDAISQSLIAQGMRRGTKEFTAEQAKIREENGVEKLPIR